MKQKPGLYNQLDGELSKANIFPHWSAALAQSIEAIEGDDFIRLLLAAINILVPCDCALMLEYSARHRPRVLFDQFDHPQRRNGLENYLRGAYLLDPFFLAAMNCSAPALVRLSELAADDFELSDYFVDYYRRSNVADELNILIPGDGNVCIALSLERVRDSKPFSEEETERLRAVVDLIAALLRRHLAHYQVKDPQVEGDREHDRLVMRLERLGQGVLTDRECEVIQLVLKGCSNLAVADRLVLSIETVKVHRRNIYRKLNISSLAELYSYALAELFKGAG